MKHLLQGTKKMQRSLLYIAVFVSTLFLSSCKKDPPQPVLTVSTIATGLKGPIGLEIDKNGRVWVAEQGTGNNDGRVSVIMPDGSRYDVITGFESVASPGGEPDGPSHLLFADGLLYILGTGGKMYKAAESSLKPGISTLTASSLGVENIGDFVLGQKFPTGESHPYNFTVGPNGDIYITDAAANLILRRQKNGVLNVVAQIPSQPNPTPVGPPQVESVPTGIYYDGQNFLVTTLTGFPFPQGKATIYKVTPAGVVSVYQSGFTTLVDIAQGNSLGRLVLEHGTFGAMGFTPFTGKLKWANGTTSTMLTDGLNQPAGLKQADEHTWYVANYGSNSVLKVRY